MQRKRKFVVVLLILVALPAILWMAFRNPDKKSLMPSISPDQHSVTATSSSRRSPASTPIYNSKSPSRAQQERFFAAFSTPISFYGKVIDQHGNPVSEANVKFSANDKPLGGKSSEYKYKTSAEGLFSIQGIIGEALLVEVSKVGYRSIPGSGGKITSSAVFEYGLDSNSGPALPTSDNPAVFTLYKYGLLEPLVRIGEKNFRIARDGSPLNISLDPTHQMVLRCWNTDLIRPAGQRQYDWKLEISATNGGVTARKDDLLFEAPETGYQPSEIINMPASLPIGQWHNSARGSYFVRFSDNTFARVNLEMQAGGDHFVVWESFLNPKNGSRNLEFDPSKTVRSP